MFFMLSLARYTIGDSRKSSFVLSIKGYTIWRKNVFACLLLASWQSEIDRKNRIISYIVGHASTYSFLLHVTREFHSVKLICRNLYAIFSHVKKTYTANQNGV